MNDWELLKTVIHYFLHLVFPVFIALIFFRKEWKKVYGLMLATMLIDLDHLFASPIFEAGRNSIGFHPLHSYPMIGAYVLGCILLKGNYKIIAIGLLFHIFTDFQDYYFWNFLHNMIK